MAKIIIPKSFYILHGINLIPSDSYLSTPNLAEVLNNQSNEYELNLENKRNYINVKTDFWSKIPAKKLSVNFDKVNSIYCKLFESFLWPEKSARFVQAKQLHLNAKKYLQVECVSSNKYNKEMNLSPLEDLTLSAQSFTLNINNFRCLKTIKFLAKPKFEENHWCSSNYFKIVNCPKLKEIDLTQIKDVGIYCHIVLKQIPEDCIIKLNPEMLKELSSVSGIKTTKTSLDFYGYKDPQKVYISPKDKEYLIKDVFKDIDISKNPIVLTFNELKTKTKEIYDKALIKAQNKEKQKSEDKKNQNSGFVR